MKLLNYARRCKNKSDHDLHKTSHAADNFKTSCGKELNEMWFIEPTTKLEFESITCKKCRKIIKETIL